MVAHARVGDAFAVRQMFSEAEKQYRAAVRGEADAGRTWMALATVVHRQGDPAETEEWIRAMERIFRFLRCNDAERLMCMSYQLKGTADYWWEAK